MDRSDLSRSVFVLLHCMFFDSVKAFFTFEEVFSLTL